MKKQPQRARLAIVKFLGPTNHRGARVKIIDASSRRAIVTLPYDYGIGNILNQAAGYLQKQGHELVTTSPGYDCDYITMHF